MPLDYDVKINVPVTSLRAVLEQYVTYALQPVAAVVQLALPDWSQFGLPDDGMTRPISAESKAVGILGSGTALMSIPIDDVMQRELPDIEDRTIATPSGPHVKLPTQVLIRHLRCRCCRVGGI